ncbi:LCP family protein [Eubacterium pyruvativorans]|uniref:LCP family protein n=1 Tax=Eubacterium pyruvativorans TaxID=155865 RepID=UPI001563DB39|nr:LCP family protein [Eubacterium pyruvativorans]
MRKDKWNSRDYYFHDPDELLKDLPDAEDDGSNYGEYERPVYDRESSRRRKHRLGGYYGDDEAGNESPGDYRSAIRDRSVYEHRSRRDEKRARRQRKAARARRRFHPIRLIRNLILILLILLLVFTGFFINMTRHMDRVDTSSQDLAIASSVASDLKGYRNIAILGSDARKGEGYDGSRTDAIIVLSINRKTNDVRMISVMRDSYLKMKYTDGRLILDKITHAHHYGGGGDTIAALNRSLDLNISEFLLFNWKAVADTVDALGGVTVNVRRNEIRDLNHYGPETARNVGGRYIRITRPGTQTLNGTAAATYCRIRKHSGGDAGRARRYKEIVAAVIRKAAVSPGKLPKLTEKVMPEIRTNMSSLDLTTLVYRAPFFHMKKSVSWPKAYWGGIIGGVWYAVPATLQSNVIWLHRRAFGQQNYRLSGQCSAINREIIAQTGVQVPNN